VRSRVQPRRAVVGWLWVAAAVSLGASLTPWGQLALYPFKLFTTWVHECSHAFVTLLVGGSVRYITIQPNTTGLTQSLVPSGLIEQGAVSSAGYLGASVVGCFLIAATRVKKMARPILLATGALMFGTLVVWMRNPFGMAMVFAWGTVLVSLGLAGGGTFSRFVLSLLAIQVALDAVYDIRVLFLVHGANSDADAMAKLFLLPSGFWAAAWMAVSVLMLLSTLWMTRGRGT